MSRPKKMEESHHFRVTEIKLMIEATLDKIDHHAM